MSRSSALANRAGRSRRDLARALAPHWAALLALALFLVAGLVVLDDYGVAQDENTQRRLGKVSLAHIRGDGALPANHNRFYGVAFEAPLVLAERALGAADERAVHLSRHLLTHLFFLAGGLFAYLLACRLFPGRLLALFVMAFFLLHPRLYAHSFLNTKDIPFLVLFVAALFFARRAFKKDALGAFALLGVVVGALVNIRITGVILFAAVPAMRVLDFALAREWAERKRILVTTGSFALAGGLTTYALLPYLWADPIGRFAEWWTTLSNHPFAPPQLFRGEVYLSSDLPADYLPVWIAITSPPFAALLGCVGAAAILLRGAARSATALRNTRLRFALLILGCFFGPILAVILLDSNMYTGWRQAYFLWAPFSLLAAFGLRWLASALKRARLGGAVYGAAGAGLAATLISMSLIHPNQDVAFTFLADRVAPERLRTQYVMDYWGHSTRQALEWLLAAHPASAVAANALTYHGKSLLIENANILPRALNERLSNSPGPDAFVIRHDAMERLELTAHSVKVYDNAITSVERKPNLQSFYEEALASEPILLNAAFDVRLVDGALAFVKEPCASSFVTEPAFSARITPADADDLPYWLRDGGFERAWFPLDGHGALADGRCVARVALPDYPIADVDVWWSPDLLSPDEARGIMRRAARAGPPLARSVYDVYLNDGDLVYAQEPCDPGGTERRFFLHVVPRREADLPAERRQYGFDNLDFDFWPRGALLDEACVAVVRLPDYPMTSIRTGQFIRGTGEIWSAPIAIEGDGRISGG